MAAAAVVLGLSFRAPQELVPLAGDIQFVRVAASQSAEAGWVLRSARSGEIRLRDARAALAPATEIVWRNERRSVELRTGSITLDVEHRPDQHFEVRTHKRLIDILQPTGKTIEALNEGLSLPPGVDIKIRVIAAGG